MILRFSLPYRTAWGQRLVVCGSEPSLGSWNLAQALPLLYNSDAGLWSQEISLPDEQPGTVEYKYILLDERDGTQQWEWGPNRTLSLPLDPRPARIELLDYWRPPVQAEHELFTNAFTQVLFRRPAASPPRRARAGRLLIEGRSAPHGIPRNLGVAYPTHGLLPPSPVWTLKCD